MFSLELDAAIKVAHQASTKILEVYQRDFTVDFKDGREPVTLADRQADEIIISGLRQKFPGDSLLTEESGFLPSATPSNNRVWFIDPIDGTKEFVKKNGEFAIQIAMAEQGILKMAVVMRPTTGEIFAALHGEGCLLHVPGELTKKISCISQSPQSLVVAMSRSHPSELGKIIGEELGLAGVFTHGGVGLKLMEIARGKAHYYLNDSNSTKAWDIAAPELLFKEAGGVVTDLLGNPFTYDPRNPYHKNGLLASCNLELHQKLLKKIAARKKAAS